jgi:hypothetical protein
MKKGGYQSLIISICIVLMICLAFYFYSYKPTQDKLMMVRKRIRGLESEIKTHEDSIAASKDVIARMKLGLINLNFFIRSGVTNEEKTPFFLRELNNFANTLGIRFLSIVPVASEKKTGYIKKAFEVSLKTDFERLLRLLLHLRSNLGLNIDSLNIELADSEGSFQITALMKINTLEMIDKEDQKVKNLEDLRISHLESEPKLKDIKLEKTQRTKIALQKPAIIKKSQRDPFKKPLKIQQIQERLKKMEREVAESKLHGIIDFEGQKHAIIGRNTVKKGDRIFNMDVLDITRDKVILGLGEVRFTYKIKKDAHQ